MEDLKFFSLLFILVLLFLLLGFDCVPEILINTINRFFLIIAVNVCFFAFASSTDDEKEKTIIRFNVFWNLSNMAGLGWVGFNFTRVVLPEFIKNLDRNIQMIIEITSVLGFVVLILVAVHKIFLEITGEESAKRRTIKYEKIRKEIEVETP